MQPVFKELPAIFQRDPRIADVGGNLAVFIGHAEHKRGVIAVDGVEVSLHAAGQIHIALLGCPLVDEPRGRAQVLPYQRISVVNPLILDIAPPLVDEKGQHNGILVG